MAESGASCSPETLGRPLNEYFTADDRCELAMNSCEPASIFNFFALYYCTFQASNLVFFPIAVSTINHSH